MSTFDEVRKTLQEIQDILIETDQLFSFKDVYQKIESNIDSLKQMIIPIDLDSNESKEDILNISIPPLKTYESIPKIESNIDLFLDDLKEIERELSENKSRPATAHGDMSMDFPFSGPEMSNRKSKVIYNKNVNDNSNNNRNEEEKSNVMTDISDNNEEYKETGCDKKEIFKRVRNVNIEDRESSGHSNGTFVVHDDRSDTSSINTEKDFDGNTQTAMV